MKNLKQKLGQLYWKSVKKYHTWHYHCKKYIRSVKVWMSGWFFRDTLSTEAAEKAQSIIVCAHPDDETIFFSTVLQEKQPFVICLSPRGNRVRHKEFYEALAHWNTNGIMLNLPDIAGFTGVWYRCAARTLLRLRKRLPNVRTVYTHSSSGESGHPHHYAVCCGVFKAFTGCKIFTTARSIPDSEAGTLSEKQVCEKYSVIRTCYPSQVKMLETWCPWWQNYLAREHFEE